MLLLLLLPGCQPAPPAPVDSGADVGEGLFLHGCPSPGRALARELTDVAETPWGPDALAAPGDVLLLNETAAFVIQGPAIANDPGKEAGGPYSPRTYVHYGGTPVDAVALDGCEQVGPEVFGEAAFIIGQIDLLDFEASTLHMFRGDTVAVVNDGKDGEAAVVEVRGTDDRFWLIELTLMRRVFEGGGRQELSDLYGLDVLVRYTLEPGASALQVDVELGGEPVTDGFLTGAVVFPPDGMESTAWASGDLSLGGVNLATGVPWVGSSTATGSTAIAMPGAAIAQTEIAGVMVLLDVNHAVTPLQIADGSATTSFVLSVGPTDGASAAAGLEAYLADPVPGTDVHWVDIGGTVASTSAAAGAAMAPAGAAVDLRCVNASGGDAVLTTFVASATGEFGGRAMLTGACSLQARQDGRDPGDPVGVDETTSGDVVLGIGPFGMITMSAHDGDGPALPVRIELERDDGTVLVDYPIPNQPFVAVPPGHWTAWITRGYEYEPVTVDVDVPEDGVTDVVIEMTHVIDTTGWASVDSHVHCGPSPDSPVLPETRMRTVAGSGLDAMISTDHEAIVDLSDAVLATSLEDQMLYVLGSEVTASLPEHTNAWPFPVVDAGRGEPVLWYGLGLEGIFAAERERGASIIQLNHARVNGECGILCLLDWDRMGEDPSTDDPDALGLTASEAIWSWDFDSFEVLNGERSPYLDPEDPQHTGALNDWFAFYNLGHHPTGVGVTDEHGMDTPGTPRTYVRVDDDTIGAFTADDLATSVLAGRAQISSGAFAEVTVDGAGPGDLASVVDGIGSLSVRVLGLKAIDVTRVEVIVNCDAALSLPASDPGGIIKLDVTADLALPVGQDSYVVVIAIGEGPMPRGLTDYDAAVVPRLITNPVRIDGDGDGVWTGPGVKTCGWAP
ncbi:MAG: hypothetical protein EXR69_00245 [Myxococcales bacterium]|nr:hypothetical protein [Myxococcales bacterium]